MQAAPCVGDFRALPPSGFGVIYAMFEREDVRSPVAESDAIATEEKQEDEARSEASTRAPQDNEPPVCWSANTECSSERESKEVVCFTSVESACSFLETQSSQSKCEYDMKCFGLLMGDAGVAKIAALLKSNTTVKSIDLSCNRIEAEGAREIADMLRSNATLTSLILRGNYLGCSGAEAIAEGLECNGSLTHLNLGGNGIYSRGSDRLVQALKVNDTLSDIVLSSNGLGQHAAKKLIDAAKDGSVEALDLRGLNVNGASAEATLLTDAALALESKRRCMVLTVDLLLSGDVACTTLAGNQVASVPGSSTLLALTKATSASTGVPEDKLKFIRPDGVTMCDAEEKKTLLELLSCDCADMPKAAPRQSVHRDWGESRYRHFAAPSPPTSIIERLQCSFPQLHPDSCQKVQTRESVTRQADRHQAVATTPVTLSEGGLLGCLKNSCGQVWRF
jgi:hypothetical protein